MSHTSIFSRERRTRETLFTVAAYGGLVCWVLLSAVGILVINDGRFIYTLDDPYIHLAMSEGIHAGVYGINNSEPAAAASSILYPFLLSWAAPYPFHQYLPLVLNLVAFSAILFVLRQFLTEAGLDRTRQGRIFATILTVAIPLVLNLVGLLFMGMEHSIQVAIELSILLGLVRFLTKARIDWWLLILIVLAPTIRYESAGASGVALLLIAANGRWKQAILTGLVLAGVVGAFSLYLVSLGLSPLPGSILAKSNVAEHAAAGTPSVFGTAIAHFVTNLLTAKGRILILLMSVMAWLQFGQKRTPRPPVDRSITVFGLCVCGIFLIGGNFSVTGRYEAATFSVAILVILYLAREWLMDILKHRSFAKLSIYSLAYAIIVGALFYRGNFTIPIASNNIYEQQYQMHRLIADHIRGPVAANDIGWISYRNDGYILDLWGLASNEAREMRKVGYSAKALERIVRDNGVELVMVYDDWFPVLRSTSWTPIARLSTSRPNIYAARSVVSFYAPNSNEILNLRQKLIEFARTLPKNIQLEIL